MDENKNHEDNDEGDNSDNNENEKRERKSQLSLLSQISDNLQDILARDCDLMMVIVYNGENVSNINNLNELCSKYGLMKQMILESKK